MRTALTIWLLALALAVTGCAAAAAGDPSAASSEAVDFEEARLAFAACMREHDVDFPDPDSSGEVDLDPEQMEDPDFREAQEACDPLLETATGDFQPDVEDWRRPTSVPAPRARRKGSEARRRRRPRT